MRISAKLKQNQAIGFGECENEAISALLTSGRAFATGEQLLFLEESIKETLAEAGRDTLEVD